MIAPPFRVCHRLQAVPQTACLPISMPSVKAREVDIDIGCRMGAAIYLTKPMDPSVLVVPVSTLLEAEYGDV